VKIFITGGAGFIGSAISKSFLDDGNEVTIFDNFSNSSEKKISSTLKIPSVIKGDISDFKSLKKALDNFDAVIHLAAQINVEESIQFPEKTFQVNVKGTENLLQVCTQNKINNLIFASSAAVYGNPEKSPLTENSPISPISPYGESKTQMEQIIKKYSRDFSLNCISLRIFNVYGIGQTDSYAGVITKFLNRIQKNQPLEIFGDGSNSRDFIALEDVTQAFVKALDNIKGKKGNYYNIGTGKSTTIKELAEIMLSICNKNLEIKFKAAKENDIAQSVASIDLAQRELGFNPKTSLLGGLENLKKEQIKY